MTASTTAGGVTLSKPALAGVVLAALVAGLVMATVFSGSGGAPRVPSPAAAGSGPDVGEIRVGPDPSGPTNARNGIGIGFAHTESGAVAAATNLILTIEQAGQASRSDAIAAYQTLASGGSAEQLGADMAAVWDAIHTGLETNAPVGAGLFIRAIPVGHDLTRYTDTRATVEVWTLTLLVAPGMTRPVATWETATVELVWEPDSGGGSDSDSSSDSNSDWRVWSVATRPGPAAGWDAVAVTDVTSFLSEMTDLEGYRYVPNN